MSKEKAKTRSKAERIQAAKIDPVTLARLALLDPKIQGKPTPADIDSLIGLVLLCQERIEKSKCNSDELPVSTTYALDKINAEKENVIGFEKALRLLGVNAGNSNGRSTGERREKELLIAWGEFWEKFHLHPLWKKGDRRGRKGPRSVVIKGSSEEQTESEVRGHFESFKKSGFTKAQLKEFRVWYDAWKLRATFDKFVDAGKKSSRLRAKKAAAKRKRGKG